MIKRKNWKFRLDMFKPDSKSWDKIAYEWTKTKSAFGVQMASHVVEEDLSSWSVWFVYTSIHRPDKEFDSGNRLSYDIRFKTAKQAMQYCERFIKKFLREEEKIIKRKTKEFYNYFRM